MKLNPRNKFYWCLPFAISANCISILNYDTLHSRVEEFYFMIALQFPEFSSLKFEFCSFEGAEKFLQFNFTKLLEFESTLMLKFHRFYDNINVLFMEHSPSHFWNLSAEKKGEKHISQGETLVKVCKFSVDTFFNFPKAFLEKVVKISVFRMPILRDRNWLKLSLGDKQAKAADDVD